ncbi:isopeptide-forming domain-containing fimbrial protein [Enterococcus faecalis]|uniref:isopeptide-forming domain-containing fimbrial protein n=80 Tax=Bacteria TaxID=2 RepID=UPI0020191400|nr:isopeptide-forming domain-containing fimbrial protein [Enterococcus faecalis]UQQ64278.1 isopeptide-forming domain-containing fimbrial protein [Enterococcus faecalis]
MNKAVKNFVSYLMITMLFILNLLPMMNAFAQEVTSDAEKTVEKDGLKVIGKIEDISSQEDIKTVTYEVTNTRDVPIKDLILKQKNTNDSPIKFVLDTLSEERGPTSLEEQAKVETNEKDQTTDIKLLNLQPNSTRKITINGQITTKASSKLLVSVLIEDNEKGTLVIDLPSKDMLADKESVSKEKQETSETKVENQASETASSTNEMTATTSNETKPEAGKATESIQETVLTQATESPGQPPLKAQPTGPLVPPTPGRGFNTPIYQSVHRGELFSTGNTNLKIANENTAAAQTFLNTRGASSGYAINNFPLEFADVDNDPNTYNSSRAYIDLNGAKEIAWAGLFWSASRYKGPAYGTNLSDEEISAPVQFTTPNGTVQRVSPQRYHRIDQDATNPGQRFGYNNTGFSNYADVTSILQGDKSATGSYTLADIPMTSSLNGQYQYYNFSGWSLFVVTKDQASKSRAFSIYYGARGNAAGTNNEFTMSNFLTAKQGNLDPIVTWFTVQGDKYWTGDNAQIKNSAGTWVNISNTLNPVNNAMNATVTDNDEHMVDKYPGKFAPDHPNFLDIDIDRMAIPEGVLNAGQNQINFRTTSSGDDYSTNAIGFAVNAETPEFEIKKEIVEPKETYKVGETITYRVSLKNTKADSEAINSVSKDALDGRLNYLPGSLKIISGPNSGEKTDASGDDQAEYDETNKQIIVRVGNGATATQGGSYKADTAETIYEFKARINERAKANELVPNSAAVEAVDILTSAKVNETSNIVEAKIADEQVTGKLTATKTVNNSKPKLGEAIEYTISFRNTIENGVLNKVVITDQLLKGLTYVKDSLTSVGDEPKPISLKEINGTITAEYLSITDTKERSIRFKVIVNEEAKAGETILNKAKVDDTVNPPEEPEVPITPEEPITPRVKEGKLAATKTVNNAKPKLGEAIEYTISFRNTIENGVLNKVVITDQLPKGLTYVKDSLTSVGDEPKPTSLKEINGTITAEYPSITDTKERSIRFKVIVNEEAKAGETILNKAKVDDTVNPPEEPEVPVVPETNAGKLTATKTVNNAKPKLGETIEYTISFRNTVENGVLNKVVITDQLPKGLTYVKDSLTSVGDEPKPTSLKEINGTITAEYPSITDTKERSIRFKVIVNEEAKAGETILNKAKVDDTVNPPEEPEVPVVPETNAGKLTATKTVNNAKPKLGETIEYTISFRNTVENGVLNKVVITDQLPKGLTYVKDSLTSVGDEPKPTSLKEINGTITAEYPSITDMKERSIRFKVIVNEEAKAGETILNKAKVDDTVNPPEEPEVPITPEEPITPRVKEGKLAATKTVNNAKPKLGEAIEYTISFRNTIENGVLNKVVITDQLPKGLTYVKDSLTSVGDEPKPTSLKEINGTITAEYPSITDTKERSIRFKVIVNEEAKAGETILNKAKVDDTVNPPEEPEVPVVPETNAGKLTATKTVNNAKPKLGETIEYTISFRNTVENGVLNKVVITDQLPKGLTYVKDSLTSVGDEPKPTSLKETNGTITAEYPSITDTKERIIRFKVIVNEEAKAGETILNKAKVDDTVNPPEEPEVPITPEEPITPRVKEGKLAATKTVNNAKPKLGEAIEYTISFRNTIENGVLNKVVITDQLPKGLTYVKDSLTSVGDEPKPTSLKEINGTITAEYPSITDTKERSIRFKVIVNEEAKAGETILNKAKVDDTVNPPEEPEVPVVPETNAGKLTATKTVNNAKPKLGETIEYTISFRNTVENGVLNKVVITDQLPKGLTYVKDSLTSVGDEPKPTSLKEANGTITAEYPSLTDMKERSIRFKVIVNEEAKAGETILNKAKVDDTVNPPEEPEVPITPEEPITPRVKEGKLAATKTVNNAKPKLGEAIEYTISFRNTIENGVLNKVVITDQLPKGLTYVKDSLTSVGDEPKPTSLKEINGTITAEYPSITDTKERSIRFKVIVNEEAKAGETILNKAKVDDTVNPPEEPEVPVVPEAKEGKLTATKTVNNAKPKLGETIEYTISFRNTIENGVLNKVVITDQLPKGLTYVKDSLTSVGDAPKPTSLKEANGTITAEYPSITDTKERSIRFKVIVNEEAKAGETILNKAKVDDTVNPPEEPEVPITPEEPAKNKKETKKVVTDQNKPTKNSKNEIAINKKETSKSSYLPKTGEKVQKIFAYLGVGLILIVLILYVIKRNKEKEE